MPLTTLLCKDKDFIIDEEGKRTFTMLNQALIKALILQSPNWDLPFEIMCGASDYTVGAVLGQCLDEKPIDMLCKQDPRRSLDKLHNYAERASGGGLRSREVLALHLGEQDHHLQ